MQRASRVTVVRFVGPSPCCGTLVRHEALVFSCSDLILGTSRTRKVIIGLLSTSSTRKVLGRIPAKVGDRSLRIMGGLLTIVKEMGMTN